MVRLLSNPFRSAAALLLCVAIALTLGASQSRATSARTAGLGIDGTILAPTLGSGYVYWVNETNSRRSDAFATLSVYQRRLVDGRERLIFKARRSAIHQVLADGDKVAFGLMTLVRTASPKHRRKLENRVYAMSAEDTTPTLVSKSGYQVKVTMRTVHRNGHAYTNNDYAICGNSSELIDVNADGQILVDQHGYSCDRRKPTGFSTIYSLSGAAPIKVHTVDDSLVALVRHGNLITNPYDTVDVTNLATGAKRRLKGHLLVDQVVMDASGYIATVAEDDSTYSDDYPVFIRIYSPGETKPAVKLTRPFELFPTVAFCAGGLVETTEGSRGAITFTLRGLADGKVLKRIKGPSRSLGYDATCEGSHLTFATRHKNGKPTVRGYDF